MKRAVDVIGEDYGLSKEERIALSKVIRDPVESLLNAFKLCPIGCVTGRDLGVDGFNVLITIEAAVSGEPVFLSTDGFIRDLSMRYSKYRPSKYFHKAVILLKELLLKLDPAETVIYLDSPIPKSGEIANELRLLLDDVARVEVVKEVDRMVSHHEVSASSDVVVIKKSKCVVDIPAAVIREEGIEPITLLPWLKRVWRVWDRW